MQEVRTSTDLRKFVERNHKLARDLARLTLRLLEQELENMQAVVRTVARDEQVWHQRVSEEMRYCQREIRYWKYIADQPSEPRGVRISEQALGQ